MQNSKREIGSPIVTLRHSLDMTQEEFAHAIGVTVSTVNRWENGHVEPSRLARKAMEILARSNNGMAPLGSAPRHPLTDESH